MTFDELVDRMKMAPSLHGHELLVLQDGLFYETEFYGIEQLGMGEATVIVLKAGDQA